MRWYIDDLRYFQFETDPDGDVAYWPFDHGHEFFIILNLAVGGWFDAPHLPPEDLAPQQLEVDYVRVYQRATP